MKFAVFGKQLNDRLCWLVPFSFSYDSVLKVIFLRFYSCVVRKSIAQVLTVINQNQKANLRKFYRNKKYVPKDLRKKKTRAMRKALSKKER